MKEQDKKIDVQRIVKQLKAMADPSNRQRQEQFAVGSNTSLGIRIPKLRALAKEIGRNQKLSLELWKTNIHEARILASMIGVAKEVDELQMEAWVADFDSWDLCDQVCMNLFDRAGGAHQKIQEWSEREEEFVKRAAFALIAATAVHDKRAGDSVFIQWFPLIEKASNDPRNFVKKAVNWALRQIGKRNLALNKQAITCAERIHKQGSSTAKWIASDALRELKSEKINVRRS